jgi:hypothetical protein
MKKNRLKLRIFGLIVGLIVLMAFGPICIGEETAETELGIDGVAGHIGAVVVAVTNIGDAVAEDITITISVEGGILGKIDIYHECSGCSQCGTTLDPGAIKTESTLEEGFIIGFGQVEITVTASASNADEVTRTLNGLVIGPFIIIT